MRMDKGKPFMDVRADYAPEGYQGDDEPPVFSEAFLYSAVGKGDARFILGIADEYAHVVEALGPKALLRVLVVKPQLAQRLGLPNVVAECLEDALSEESLWREQRLPSQVILDEEAAHDVWTLLHDEYKRHFDPDTTMDRSTLRAYNALTDGLGDWEQKERQKERDRLPEKLKKKAEKEEQLAVRKANRHARQDAARAILDRYKDDPGATTDFVARQVEHALRGVKDAA